MIIDLHTHAFPDFLAKRAVAALEQHSGDWKALTDGTLAGLVASMDRAGVDVSVVCPIATKPEQTEGIFQWAVQASSPRLAFFPSVHPDDSDMPGWMARIAAAGFRGVKLHPMYQDFVVDDDRALAMYSAARAAGLLVIIHCGNDIAWPEDFDRARPRRVRNAMDQLPGLKLVATHMGGWRMWPEVRECLLGTDCWLETSASLDLLPPAEAADMIRQHGTSRVLFGTDSPWFDPADELARLRTLGLSAEELAMIEGDNAVKLLGL